jgi:hypothetical protein
MRIHKQLILSYILAHPDEAESVIDELSPGFRGTVQDAIQSLREDIAKNDESSWAGS